MTDFVCPGCGEAALRITVAFELPADSRSDEITVQGLRCGDCGARGVAVYEESRRGRLDSDCWVHGGYALPPEAAAELHGLIDGCPRPRDPHCRCPAHLALGATDADGRWNGLAAWPLGPRFPMRLASGD